ncbi:hypothetical protein [Actinoplanes derwentensis]|uniref:Uncharacterized protein n=1 Tax=Actinoplanes derwentensis TaxID=113562 RepID=A0A1H1XPB9_9ACTN|nr:hypothetical protein [Actinoplanes derwentensis]SDT11073.1 hypothetical protein SAMN04489716_2537 [Actinoplanes derwentensis]
MLIDQPLATGQVDGQGAFHGYPFLGNGSTGFPDAPTVLRSYFGHDALEVRLADDEFDHNDVNDYPDSVVEVDEMAAKHGIDMNDARDGVLLYRVGSDQEADLIVTERDWLLAERHRPYGQLLANVVSPDEALAIIGLYLRWHQRPVIIGGSATRWHPTSMRRSAAYIAMPAFERWNQAGRVWYDTKNDLTLENLNRTLLTRISRAFQFRDSIFALSATMVGHEPEDMLCELDSLLFSLVGAFDVAARITDVVLGRNGGRRGGWQNTQNGEWQSSLEPVAKDLFDHTKPGSEMQHAFRVLRDLRNSVHNEAINLTRADGTFYLTTEPTTQGRLRSFLRESHPGWTTTTLGIKVQPPGGATQGRWVPGVGRYTVTVRGQAPGSGVTADLSSCAG